MIIKKKKDKFRKVRGGKATILDIKCGQCGNEIMVYQKDGTGNLFRCYLNRIFAPEKLAKLQYDENIQEKNDMPNLVCKKCETLIGIPMKHQDGRLAFRLRKGYYHKKQTNKTVKNESRHKKLSTKYR